MKNRDLAFNTFEGGLDMDTEIKNLQQNRYREAYNIDIIQTGSETAVTDLKGESVIGVLESLGNADVHLLAVTNAQFLTEPTDETDEALVFFYNRRQGSNYQFIIKALFVDEQRFVTMYSESISQDDWDFLLDSSISLKKVGSFGYDTIYFVDNRRQPRKLDCVIYQTNDSVATLTLNSVVDGSNFKDVILNANIDVLPNDPFRMYIYAYKDGQAFIQNPNNPLSDSIKFADFDGSSLTKQVTFRIYEEDFASYTFIIRYHRDGTNIYRNFTIGTPDRVIVEVGTLTDTLIVRESTSNTPGTTQPQSWDFLYTGAVLTAYMDTPTLQVGTTKLYRNNVARSGNLLANGFYQDFTNPNINTFIQVSSGVVVARDINNANVVLTVSPSVIDSAVRIGATTITEGNRQRLQTITYSLPAVVTVNDVDYEHTSTVAGTKSGGVNFSYTMERNGEQSPVASYRIMQITVTVGDINVQQASIRSINITYRIGLSAVLNEDITVEWNHPASEGGQAIVGVVGSGTVPSGQTFADFDFMVSGQNWNEIEMGTLCVSNITYRGPEDIVNNQACD